MSTDIKTTGKRPVITPLIQLGTLLINAKKWTLLIRKLMLEMAPTAATGMAQKMTKAVTKAMVAE